MENDSRRSRRSSNFGRTAWLTLTIIIFVGTSLWQTSVITSKDINAYSSLQFQYLDDIASSISTDGGQDAVTAYAQNIDLTVVPPKGSPPSIPAARATEEEKREVGSLRARYQYGGNGDKAHLGGFTKIDPDGISPYMWRGMMEYFGVKTLLDVGCGRGFSTSWFYMQGVDVQCIEGSHSAVENNLLPPLIRERAKQEGRDDEAEIEKEINKRLVEHDFSLGPYWPEDTVDAVWSVELLEHVGRNFQQNYLTAFKKAAFIFVTHSIWGGWHHTEVHDDLWWIHRLEMYGFKYSAGLTEKAKSFSLAERDAGVPFPVPDDKNKPRNYRAIHLNMRLLVFINPLVAGRLEHSHLMSEPGCFNDYGIPNSHCGEEKNGHSRAVNTPIPDEFKFIPYKEDKHKAWEEAVRATASKGGVL